jgi:hypothetical protein
VLDRGALSRARLDDRRDGPSGNFNFTGIVLAWRLNGKAWTMRVNFPRYVRWFGPIIGFFRGSAEIGIAAAIALIMLYFVLLVGVGGDLGVSLKDNKDLAPWVSGTATTFGVWVALWNAARQRTDANARETREVERKASQASADKAAAKAATEEILKGIAALLESTVFSLTQAASTPVGLRRYINSGAAETALTHARTVLTRFPVNTVGSATHAQAIFALELSLNTLIGHGLQLKGAQLQTVSSTTPSILNTLGHMVVSIPILRRPLP